MWHFLCKSDEIIGGQTPSGYPGKELSVGSISEDIRRRRDEELQYYLDHGDWPEGDSLTEGHGSNGAKPDEQRYHTSSFLFSRTFRKKFTSRSPSAIPLTSWTCRRGLGSNLYRLGAPDKVIQLILRHANVATTLGFYVKPSGPDVIAAMGKFEQSLDEQSAAHAVQDCYGTAKTGSGATPESVN
jgi:hypothetical protein